MYKKKSMHIRGIFYRYTFRAFCSCTNQKVCISQESEAISIGFQRIPFGSGLRDTDPASGRQGKDLTSSFKHLLKSFSGIPLETIRALTPTHLPADPRTCISEESDSDVARFEKYAYPRNLFIPGIRGRGVMHLLTHARVHIARTLKSQI